MAINAVNDGIAQYNRRNFPGSVSAFERAILADDSWGMPYYYLGMVRLHAYASAETAVPELTMAVGLMPDHAPTFYQLGIAYRQMGDLGEAREAFEETVELDPEHGRAHYRLGLILEAEGDVMEAIEAYTHSIYSDPRFANPYVELGSIYARYEFWDEAAAVFENGYENTGEATLANRLGGMHLRAGRLNEAITYFEEALAFQPESTIFNYDLGMAYGRWYLESNNPAHREQATEYLNTASRRCGEHGSQARCNSIQQLLDEMTQAEESTQQP